MSDITLSDGREITFDFKKLTITEFRDLRNPEKAGEDDKGDEILARVIGLTKKKLQDLSYYDYRLVTRTFWERAIDPLSDPN